MNKISIFIKKFADAVNPELPVGGLEISDTFLRYAAFEDGKLRTAYIRLAPGILADGAVSDSPKLIKALQELKAKLGSDSHHQNVIATMRSGSIYAQMFNLPQLPASAQAEAVALNLKSISPLPYGAAYADAEIVGEGASSELEFLGAFAPRKLIDDLNIALTEAGFFPLAFEFGALSVARVIRELGGYGAEISRLAISVMNDGVDFMILRNGNLYFHYWSSWESVTEPHGKREIDLETFNQLIYREVGRLLQFYTSKWGGAITNVIIIAPGWPEESSRLLTDSFGLRVEALSLKDFGELGSEWLGVLGAALRGNTPRFKDIFISLAPVGTEIGFARNRLRHFLGLWRNITLASGIFLVVLFVLGLSVLAREESKLKRDALRSVSPESLAEVTVLETEAKNFNSRLAAALAAKREAKPLSGIMSELRRVSGVAVTITGLAIQADSGSIRVIGRAPSELAAITFKNALSANPNFKDVSLPFANITSQPDGSVNFQLTLAFK